MPPVAIEKVSARAVTRVVKVPSRRPTNESKLSDTV